MSVVIHAHMMKEVIIKLLELCKVESKISFLGFLVNELSNQPSSKTREVHFTCLREYDCNILRVKFWWQSAFDLQIFSLFHYLLTSLVLRLLTK